jgi:hypothetical protein
MPLESLINARAAITVYEVRVIDGKPVYTKMDDWGIENRRAMDEYDCPYCKEIVANDEKSALQLLENLTLPRPYS